MSYFIGVCRHCGFRLGAALVLCDSCASKALKTLPSSVSERIEIYKLLIQHSDNTVVKICVEQLMALDMATLEEETIDPTDRMFNPRGE